MKVNLGSGDSPEAGFINIDIQRSGAVDVLCDVRHLPFRSMVLDLVRSSHVLEHIPWGDVDQTLKEWLRTLKPGGYLDLYVPNFLYGSLAFLMMPTESRIARDGLNLIFGTQTGPALVHMGGFSRRYLRMKVSRAGFAQIRTSGARHSPSGTAWRRILSRVFMRLIPFEIRCTAMKSTTGTRNGTSFGQSINSRQPALSEIPFSVRR